MRKRDKKKSRKEIVVALSMVLQMGLTTMTCMVVSFCIGLYIDKLFRTKWGVPVFLVIGIMASIRSLLILNKRYFPDKKNASEGGEDGESKG